MATKRANAEQVDGGRVELTSPPSPQDRAAFYGAAVLGLRALDARERTPRRFGADADARWTQFAGALGVGDRIDILLRDAAGTWGAAFSPSECFGFFGLADDEPFGPDWDGIDDHAAKKLLADPSGSPSLDSVAAALGVKAASVVIPPLSPSTKLVVAGGAAFVAVAKAFAENRALSWTDQVVAIADKGAFRQLAKLDVPKERFVTVPGGNTDEDTTPLVGWAGWNHLQVAEALAALYLRRRDGDWNEQDVRLSPLLAGIAERVPWLLQWHNEPSAAYGGSSPALFIRDLVADGARRLGVAIGDLHKWTPPAATRRTAVDPSEVLAALQSWKPEVDEDEDGDEEAEQPEGPTEADLASEVGVTKTLIKKALKKLEADGLVEKLSGRPARYVATGDGA